MEAFHSQIRLIHIVAVCASGGLFLARGLLINLFASRWAMAAPVRYLSYSIDTVLLAAAIALAVITRQYPGVDAWLTVKVVLLAVYVVLGSFALKRGRTPRSRMLFWIAALAVFAFIASVARAHHPLGIFASLAG